jgi:two-component system invasion response regulator UvrY
VGQARLPARKIREVLRLKAEGLSDRQMAAAISSARCTLQECARRARDAGLVWPLPTDEAASLGTSSMSASDFPGKLLHESLSTREFQIFCKLAAGISVSAISQEFELERENRQHESQSDTPKLGFSSNADVTAYAMRHGLIQ